VLRPPASGRRGTAHVLQASTSSSVRQGFSFPTKTGSLGGAASSHDQRCRQLQRARACSLRRKVQRVATPRRPRHRRSGPTTSPRRQDCKTPPTLGANCAVATRRGSSVRPRSDGGRSGLVNPAQDALAVVLVVVVADPYCALKRRELLVNMGGLQSGVSVDPSDAQTARRCGQNAPSTGASAVATPQRLATSDRQGQQEQASHIRHRWLLKAR
jgi:hypothetical protein